MNDAKIEIWSSQVALNARTPPGTFDTCKIASQTQRPPRGGVHAHLVDDGHDERDEDEERGEPHEHHLTRS
jgi:hypothetical protein